MAVRQINAEKYTYIGQEGENNATQVNFSLPDTWEGAKAEDMVLKFTRPGEKEPDFYDVTSAYGVAHWLVPESATYKGVGKMELVWVYGDGGTLSDFTVKKSLMFNTMCEDSVGEARVGAEVKSTWHDDIVKIVRLFRMGQIAQVVNVEEKPLTEDAVHGTFYVVGGKDVWLFDRVGNWIQCNGGSSVEPYTGTYEMTSNFVGDQYADCNNKRMTQDFKVNKMPLSEVDNPEGGKTCTVG